MKSPLSVRRLRMSSALLGVTLLSGAIVVAATPAHAIVAEEYLITGTVNAVDADGNAVSAAGVFVDLYQAPYEEGDLPFDETETEELGSFVFEAIPPGDYEVDLYFPDDATYMPGTWEFTVDGDEELGPFTLEPWPDSVPAGEMTISGKAAVGETLTIETSGWPSGTTLTYEWGWYVPERMGGPIDGETGQTYTVTAEHIGHAISAFVTGTKDGYAPTTISLFGNDIVSVPKKPAAPAPVADSDDLGSYLVGKGSTPQPQDSVGLPAGSLDPAKGYSADLPWDSADSFVDVYLYSTPVFLGTFPVVNGVVQIELSADVLSELGAGGHTLVVLGQSSGAVSSVSLSIAAMLASTGVDPIAAFSASGAFLLLGALSLLAARRNRSKA